MYVVAVLGLTAFFLCLITTPLIRNLFLRARLVDHPDEERKFHRKAIPRVGGIAVLLSYLGSLALILLLAPQEVALSIRQNGLLLSMLPAVVLIFITGLFDDLITLKPRQKLIGQALAAALAITLGVRINLPQGPEWLAIIISFFWLLACANALNLIDGMDGLASGVALFATVTIILVSIIEGNLAFAIVVIPLAGCLIAFLHYNFSPASIFLGDCGSLTIGFMLGCFGLIWSRSSVGMVGMAAPLITLSLPLLDLALAVMRRFLRNVPIFKGDRYHIHHKILARSIATRKAIQVLYSVCAVASTFALLLYFSEPRFKLLISFTFFFLVLLGIKQLRYIEFTTMTQYLSRRAVSKSVREEVHLSEFKKAIAKAESAEAVWSIACNVCEQFQITNLKMKINNRSYQENTTPHQNVVPWQMIVPLGAKGEISLSWTSQPETFHHMLAVLNCLQLSILQKSFPDKWDEFEELDISYSQTSVGAGWLSSGSLETNLNSAVMSESSRHSVSVSESFMPTAQ